MVTFALDIDGTLDNGRKGQIYPPIIELLAEWLERGANLIFVTNRPSTWVAEKLLEPIRLAFAHPSCGRVLTACEQGAVVSEVELRRELPLRYHQLRRWPLEQKTAVQMHIAKAIAQGTVAGRFRKQLECQICLELERIFSGNPYVLLPAGSRPVTRVVQTRSTLTFLSRDAGKDVAARYILATFPELASGYVLGFGDDGDEFASVIPVLDVDRFRRGTFQKEGYRSALVHESGAFEKLGLPPLPQCPGVAEKLAQGGGIATAAVLELASHILA